MQRLLSSAPALVISVAVLWWLVSDEVIAALVRSLPGARLWQLVLAVLLMPAIQAIRAAATAIVAGLDVLPVFAMPTRLSPAPGGSAS